MGEIDDFLFICSKIDSEKDFLNSISQEIWKKPELRFEEIYAHDLLTNALTKYGFQVQKKYILDTAFRTEYSSKAGGGPTVAVLLEYDALPEIGHACGHNLIAEAGLAVAIAIKALMDKDTSLSGKLIIMGTPAEEGGGGKVKLIENGAFEGIDAALMTHPCVMSYVFPFLLCIIRATVEFVGRESHASAAPWMGKNALDAAVACYNNLSLLRQQIKPQQKMHVIITEGGTATNIIPAKATLELCIRAPTMGEVNMLKENVENCINGAALSTGCKVNIHFSRTMYENMINNKVIGNIYKRYCDHFGVKFDSDETARSHVGSTDMGNVSHVVPSIHPFYKISDKYVNHTKGFTEVAGSPAAQEPTLISAKSIAMTAITLMRNPKIMQDVKDKFNSDILKDLEEKLI